ncbi:MAG: hypothetical protein HY069_00890 [Chlamydiia bacterium]|nr:hypothetical protein [Chlamydiia bacterium]
MFLVNAVKTMGAGLVAVKERADAFCEKHQTLVKTVKVAAATAAAAGVTYLGYLNRDSLKNVALTLKDKVFKSALDRAVAPHVDHFAALRKDSAKNGLDKLVDQFALYCKELTQQGSDIAEGRDLLSLLAETAGICARSTIALETVAEVDALQKAREAASAAFGNFVAPAARTIARVVINGHAADVQVNG